MRGLSKTKRIWTFTHWLLSPLFAIGLAGRRNGLRIIHSFVVVIIRRWGVIDRRITSLSGCVYARRIHGGEHGRRCCARGHLMKMWEKPTCWALMKEGRKSAVRIHWDGPPELPADEKHFIEVREGERNALQVLLPCLKVLQPVSI